MNQPSNRSVPRRGRQKLSAISLLHYTKLVFRSALFLAALVAYIVNRVKNTGETFGGYEDSQGLLALIWLVFATEMLLRFFPSKYESKGCQKQFGRNYLPTGKPPVQTSPRAVAGVALSWLGLNGAVGALYFAGIIDRGILLLISLAYSVCDMICILFFCPFQTWFMKNKCCATCRIYNWDYAMMFTPLVFVSGFYTWSLLAFSLALLVQWEVIFACHPQRFSEASNADLTCANCREKLCQHKRQLRQFHKKLRSLLKYQEE